ncbi:MAG: electron transport complex subunit RsxE, partial [Clostridiales bacterium]|nr:electron transport complex subunit RsxE [Clostridiales bacterium]
PLIVVNCIILARAEAFASKNGVLASAMDGIGMGIGFTLAMLLMGAVREILGNGTIFGAQVLGAGFEPVLLFILAPGGFLAYGLLLGIINAIGNRREAKKAIKGGEAA